MHFAVLAQQNSWYFGDLERAAKGLGQGITRLDFQEFVATEVRPAAGESGDLAADALIVRSMPAGSLEQVIFRMDVLARFEASGLPVVNPPKSLECAIDKYLTTARLQAAGVPVPPTIVCETTTAALSALERLEGDVVVKPMFGAEGRGIVRVTDPDMGWRVFSTLERLQSVIYLQKFIEHPGFDTRVLVLDGNIIGGMKRYSPNDFRTNVARSGRGEFHQPTALEAELAIRAAQATGVRFAGIDILQSRDGEPLVLEVNAVPGWRAFALVTGIDVATRFLDHLSRHPTGG